VEHSSNVFGIERGEDEQIGPRAELGDLCLFKVGVLPPRHGMGVYMVCVPGGLEGRRKGGLSGGGKGGACYDLQRDIVDAVETGNDGAAEFEGGGVCEGDEDFERALGRLRGHGVAARGGEWCVRSQSLVAGET
jgi:hypothetical protein